MREIEISLQKQGLHFIAGIDEAGRGPLAGPVVASAVILPSQVNIQGVDDSKKLSPALREKALSTIFEKALSIGIGIVSERLIERINILEGTRLAMVRAVESLDVDPDYLIIDGITPIESNLPQKTVMKGDSLSISIAAASIVAKVTRDRMMDSLHKKYPHYAFHKHKGYGTKEHLAKIREFGPCEAHRKSFKGVKEYVLGVS